MTQYFRLSPETRNCYGEDEISLKFLPKSKGYRSDNKVFGYGLNFSFRYEMSNCLFEATFERILEECKVYDNLLT